MLVGIRPGRNRILNPLTVSEQSCMVHDCRSDRILMFLVDQGTLRPGKTSGKRLVPGKSEAQKEIEADPRSVLSAYNINNKTAI